MDRPACLRFEGVTDASALRQILLTRKDLIGRFQLLHTAPNTYAYLRLKEPTYAGRVCWYFRKYKIYQAGVELLISLAPARNFSLPQPTQPAEYTCNLRNVVRATARDRLPPADAPDIVNQLRLQRFEPDRTYSIGTNTDPMPTTGSIATQTEPDVLVKSITNSAPNSILRAIALGTCPVCLIEWASKGADQIYMLPCGHVVCKICVEALFYGRRKTASINVGFRFPKPSHYQGREAMCPCCRRHIIDYECNLLHF